MTAYKAVNPHTNKVYGTYKTQEEAEKIIEGIQLGGAQAELLIDRNNTTIEEVSESDLVNINDVVYVKAKVICRWGYSENYNLRKGLTLQCNGTKNNTFEIPLDNNEVFREVSNELGMRISGSYSKNGDLVWFFDEGLVDHYDYFDTSDKLSTSMGLSSTKILFKKHDKDWKEERCDPEWYPLSSDRVKKALADMGISYEELLKRQGVE